MDNKEGSQALREAITLAPENAEVEAAFAKLRLYDSSEVLLKLCDRFTQNQDVVAGKEALSYLASRGSEVTDILAEKCLQPLIENGHALDRGVRDALVASFLQHCRGARAFLVQRLHDSVSVIFQKVFDIGDGAANAMAATVLDQASWSTKAARSKFETDILHLFVAKLMESGHDYDGRAIKGISRLLAVDAQLLHSALDEESFDAILASLDNRWPSEVRSQATLATAKYLEVAPDKGQEYLTRFITMRVTRHANDDLIVAFSAAAAIFPLVPSVAASLFLAEGFLPSLALLLEKGAKSQKVEQAALDMFSAACVDSACREAIAKYCRRWLHLTAKIGQGQIKGQAAVILAKVKTSNSTGAEEKGVNQSKKYSTDVVPMFASMLLDGSDADRKNAIEGLAYVSIEPKDKEQIIQNQALLKRLTHLKGHGGELLSGAKGNSSNSRVLFSSNSGSEQGLNPGENPFALEVAFGSLSIFYNLTQYLPRLSEEEKRMSQLKAYANASKSSSSPDPLDDDVHVSRRSKALLDANVVPYLAFLERAAKPKGLSPASLTLIARILHSIARTPANRGKLAQQGAIILLHAIYVAAPVDKQCRRIASHAIALIFISINPSLLNTNMERSATMILSLLDDELSEDVDSSRDQLPKFEGLLALTNLASNPADPEPTNKIIKKAFETIEDLLLSSNTLVQRAATELVCNLVTTSSGIEKFADGSRAADRRIHILLALADAEDVATRRAAGGALAAATEFGPVVESILGRERGVKILLALCQDEDKPCIIRGVVCINNSVSHDGDIGRTACQAVKDLGGVDVLQSLVRNSENQMVVEQSAAALEIILG